jgi:chromosome segregation ATPase
MSNFNNFNMKDLIQKLKSYSGYIFGGIAIDSYRRTMNTEELNRVIQESATRLETKVSYIERLRAKLHISQDKITGLETKTVSIKGRILEYMEQINANKAKLVEYNQSPEENKELIDVVHRQSVDIMGRLSSELQELEETVGLEQQVLEITLKKIEEASSSTTEFMSDYLDKINTIFSELSTAQLGAIGHIFLCIGIYYSVTNIASAYYGDKLIIYFKLETRYPRLAR